MSSVDDDLQTALQLSPKERARLAHSLIVSLDDAESDDDVEDAWAEEISLSFKRLWLSESKKRHE